MSKQLFKFLIFLCLYGLQYLQSQNYIFFLHNKFVEMEGISGVSADYGMAEYHEITSSFRNEGFTVISEIRPRDTDGKIYAGKVVKQIDSLLKKGIKPSQITVIGTSKGGFIAQYVSSTIKNPGLNFVFIGSCLEQDAGSGVHFCGNILSIYEASDEYGQSCAKILASSTLTVPHYREIRLNTGARHGYLYKPLPLWIKPAIQWAKGNYDLKPSGNQNDLTARIDSLLSAPNPKPFNGIVLIKHKTGTEYVKVMGYSNLEKKVPLRLNDQFYIGSVSKQITAVIVLQEVDKGHIQLHIPIRKYLPWLKQAWADSITVHHLLSHTHGIKDLDSPLLFRPGTNLYYTHVGFDLLAKIAEQSSGKSFAELSSALFKSCAVNNTFHPSLNPEQRLVKGYREQEDGRISLDTGSVMSIIPAGGFISGAYDMVFWNNCLHHGKLLSETSYRLMMSKQPNALRQHSVLGLTAYGYGITVIDSDSMLQFGQTGLVNGFVSMNYYFPGTETSLVILENIRYDPENLKNTFRYHVAIMEILRQELLARQH